MKAFAAFSITVALVTPATLTADIQTDGPEIRPARQSVTIGDATVTVDLDRGVMREGDTVSGVLVATSTRAHDVVVDVDAMEDMGMGDERVPNPPREAGSRTLTLHARPGGGPPVVASFKLGSRKAVAGTSSWFDLHVHRHGKHNEEAVASVATFGGNPIEIAIEPPVKIPATGSFTVAVRIKNTMKRDVEYVGIQLGSRLTYNGMDGLWAYADEVFDAKQIDEQDGPLAAGAERLAIFKIEAKDPALKHFAFVALARLDGLEAMEVKTFDRAAPEPQPDDTHTVATTR